MEHSIFHFDFGRLFARLPRRVLFFLFIFLFFSNFLHFFSSIAVFYFPLWMDFALCGVRLYRCHYVVVVVAVFLVSEKDEVATMKNSQPTHE